MCDAYRAGRVLCFVESMELTNKKKTAAAAATANVLLVISVRSPVAIDSTYFTFNALDFAGHRCVFF